MIFGNNGSFEHNYETEEMSNESLSLITEAAMLDALTEEELDAFLESSSDVNAMLRQEVLMEKSIVRLDKKAKLSRAHKMAIFTMAKEKNDRDYKKLVTLWRMERVLEAKLYKKYANPAMSRAKASLKKIAKAPTTVTNKLVNQTNRMLNGGIKRK